MLEFDVIVIGAGIAGLAAAERIGEAGRRTCIIEARERIGGRVYTTGSPASVPIELGAEFIHGRPPELWSIVQTTKLRIAEARGVSWCAQDGKLAPCSEFARVGASMNLILEHAPPPDQPDVPFQKLLDVYFAEERFAEMRAAATRYVEGFHAARAERISAQALVRGEAASARTEGGRAFRLLDGYGKVIEHLCARLSGDVRLELCTVVERIYWEQGAVSVCAQRADGTGATFRARACIVTIPLGVLRASPDARGAILFSPDLSEKRAAMLKIEVGQVVRLNLIFRRRWWPEFLRARYDQRKATERMGFLFARDEPFPTWWTQHPAHTPVLVGWAGGSRAERLLASGDVVEQAISSLCRIFGSERREMEALIEEVRWHDWSADPFARGSYSYIGVGGLYAPQALAQPVADTLFFAGEATNTAGHEATVHGALQTGQRAAEEVIAALAKKS
ncbi:MAG: FAD-dependent oxidoreductase [Pyrinomonas sp.]|uniref:flavin monoamine oxidase family protein n=1 Tax=Pyrinomonas sp. TaxID=2080306 RepID=UPI00332B0886